MLISRKELSTRFTSRAFNTFEEMEELVSVEKLFKEAQAEAPFRNHDYMFDKKVPFKKLKLQETEVGIKKKYPYIKTEGQRFKRIEQEVRNDTYKSVEIFRDADYPDDIFINDGFHRIYSAHKLGHRVMRCKVKIGKFILEKSISFEDLAPLLNMVKGMFKGMTIDEIYKLIKKVNKKGKANYSIGYGKYDEEKR